MSVLKYGLTSLIEINMHFKYISSLELDQYQLEINLYSIEQNVSVYF